MNSAGDSLMVVAAICLGNRRSLRRRFSMFLYVIRTERVSALQSPMAKVATRCECQWP